MVKDKTKAKQRKNDHLAKQLVRRGVIAPPRDKMIKAPERKKEIWELLAEREKNIHSGEI